ncbi:MAG: hypothetical protein QOH25_1580 [Acidobacteriota bacterium]|jgi:hypothetical protein|nr:hypothetical protein [Acidobacteriota bacterium]
MLRVEARETTALKREATRLGIDIPRRADWWWEDEDGYEGMTLEAIELTREQNLYLTELGKAGVKKLIRDEKRRNVEWWLRVVGSIIALITGLLGALIGVLAFLTK